MKILVAYRCSCGTLVLERRKKMPPFCPCRGDGVTFEERVELTKLTKEDFPAKPTELPGQTFLQFPYLQGGLF